MTVCGARVATGAATDVSLIDDYVSHNLTDLDRSIFKGVPRAVLHEMCRFMQYQEVLPGTVLYRQGEVGNSMYYIVLKGVCSVFVRSQTEQLRVEAEFERRRAQGLGDRIPSEHLGKRVATCVAGTGFGEEALGNDDVLLSQRTCTAVAGPCPTGVLSNKKDPALMLYALGLEAKQREDLVKVLCLHRTAFTKILQADASGALASKVLDTASQLCGSLLTCAMHDAAGSVLAVSVPVLQVATTSSHASRAGCTRHSTVAA